VRPKCAVGSEVRVRQERRHRAIRTAGSHLELTYDI